MGDAPAFEGYLWKTDPDASHWRRRYFVLSEYQLGYKKTNGSKKFLKDPLDLETVEIIPSPDLGIKLKQRTDFGFRMKDRYNGRTYHLCATSDWEKQKWCQVLQHSTNILMANARRQRQSVEGSNDTSPFQDRSDDDVMQEQNHVGEQYNIHSFDGLQGTYEDFNAEASHVKDSEEEEDSIAFFLKIVGTSRKFEVVLPEAEAEDMTIMELKEQFTDAVGTAPDDMVMSIQGEVLRDDFRGFEIGLTEGTIIEVSVKEDSNLPPLPSVGETEPPLSPGGGTRLATRNMFEDMKNDDGRPELDQDTSPPPKPSPPKEEKVSPALSKPDPIVSPEIAVRTQRLQKKGRKSFVFGKTPAVGEELLEVGTKTTRPAKSASPSSPRDQARSKVVQTFDVSPTDKPEEAIQRMCTLAGLDYQKVGPTLVSQVEDMRQATSTTQSIESPSNSEREKHLEKMLADEQRLRMNLAIRLEEMDKKMNSLKHDATAHNYSRDIEDMKADHAAKVKMLENAINRRDQQIEQLQSTVPGAPRDEIVMGLRDQVDQLTKRLRAARTLSAFEANKLESENSPLGSPLGDSTPLGLGSRDTLLGPSHIGSPRTPGQSRGQWREFMEEKRQLIARANHDREKLMNENRQLRAQLLREQGFSKYSDNTPMVSTDQRLGIHSYGVYEAHRGATNPNIYPL